MIRTLCFRFKRQLEKVNLSNNQIGILKLENLDNNKFESLIELDLSQNRIKEIQIDYFRVFPHLRKLNLSANTLSDLENVFTQGLRNLVDLDLSQTDIDDKVLRQIKALVNLEKLNLSSNKQLTKLDLRSFTRLKEVQANNNSISDIQIFPENTLKVLNLSNNQIKQLEYSVFEKLNNLEELDLSGNGLTSENFFSDEKVFVLSKNSNLKILRLSNNEIKNDFIKALSENCTQLIELDLYRNKLESIDREDFKKFTNLQKLNLGYNQFNFKISQKSNQTYNNKTESIDKQDFQEFKEFKDSLSFKKRNASLNAFKDLEHLNDLNLSRNRLHFKDLIKEEEKKQNQNNKNEPPRVLNTKMFKSLDLSYNRLTNKYMNFSINKFSNLEKL